MPPSAIHHRSLPSAASGRQAFRFILLAYAISWLWWIVRFSPHLAAWIKDNQPILRSDLGPWDVQIGMAGPLVAALLLTWAIDKGDVRRLFVFRRPWKDYLLAVILPAALVGGTVVLLHLSGLARFTWAGENPWTVLPLLVPIILIASLTAIGEEAGWRGYLLPRLASLGEVKATLITGLIWGIWHLPLLLTGLTFPGEPAAAAVPAFLFTVCMLSFPFTWLSRACWGDRISGLGVAALLHGTLNALSELTTPGHFPGSPQWLVSPLGLAVGALAGLVVLVYYTFIVRGQKQEAAKVESRAIITPPRH
jgi:membrane protease YdiL (CAAX protease family)